MANKHAILSASSGGRWITCPLSAKLCETKPDTFGEYTRLTGLMVFVVDCFGWMGGSISYLTSCVLSNFFLFMTMGGQKNGIKGCSPVACVFSELFSSSFFFISKFML